jgi:carbamoyl-phosphate synthase large subunit
MPMGGEPGYIPALCEILKHEKVDVLLPGSDEEAFAVAANLPEIKAAGAKAIVSPKPVLDLIANKYRTYQSLQAAGIPVPEHTLVTTAAELRDAVLDYDYPRRTVVFKPVSGRGGRGLHVLCGHDSPPVWLGGGARESRLEGFDPGVEALVPIMDGPTLVMPCLMAPAYDADVLAIGNGQHAVAVRKRSNPAGIPFTGNTLLADSSVTEYCRAVAKVLELDALHDIDLMTGPNGSPMVLEVNPRPSGSMIATLAAGFPFLDWAVARQIGISFTSREPEREIEILAFTSAFAVPLA